jgi:hypothetical protein
MNHPTKENENASVNALAREGGLARARTLTPEQRSEIARKAAISRWDRRTDRELTRSVVSYLKTDHEGAFIKQTEIDALDEVSESIRKHQISTNCPCDECIDSVIDNIRDQYMAALAKIDAGQKLDKDEDALFKLLIGKKANRWTQRYREECRRHKQGT